MYGERYIVFLLDEQAMNTRIKSLLPMLFLSIVIALSSFSGVFSLPSVVYVGAIFVFFLSSIAPHLNKVRFGSVGILFLLIICIVSILINKPAFYFKAWQRLFVFFLVILSFSPLLVNRTINIKRLQLFQTLIWVMLSFSISSFFAYFLGINYFVRNDVLLDYTEAGHFSGFTNHSMMLAPISSMSCIYSFSCILYHWGNKGQVKKWICLFVLCLGSLLLSASRGAIAGVVLGLIVTLFRYNSGKLFKTIKYAILAVSIAIITFPVWGSLTSSVIEKSNYNESQGGFMYSRETKMAARIYEIENNFFTGVGFSAIDESVDDVDKVSGTIEPNSSWLGVFSMTGVFGFIIFLSVFINTALLAIKKITDITTSSMMCGFLAFFLIHLMIEGYVLAGGSILCGLFWLTIGITYSLTEGNYKILT